LEAPFEATDNPPPLVGKLNGNAHRTALSPSKLASSSE
jgi:hypothetical protein